VDRSIAERLRIRGARGTHADARDGDRKLELSHRNQPPSWTRPVCPRRSSARTARSTRATRLRSSLPHSHPWPIGHPRLTRINTRAQIADSSLEAAGSPGNPTSRARSAFPCATRGPSCGGSCVYGPPGCPNSAPLNGEVPAKSVVRVLATITREPPRPDPIIRSDAMPTETPNSKSACLQGLPDRRSRRGDSNPGPHHYELSAPSS
jgi:hypothetical protein